MTKIGSKIKNINILRKKMKKTKAEIRSEIKEVLEDIITMYELPTVDITDNLLLIETLGFSSFFDLIIDKRCSKN